MGLVTEKELVERAVAPRVTEEQITADIADVSYHRLTGTLLICTIVMKNGFTVTGESACASPENFRQDIGERLSYKQAFNRLWIPYGFALRTNLQLIDEASVPSLPHMQTYVGTKVVHAAPMDRLSYNALRGWEVPVDEDPKDEGYLVEYSDGGASNVEGFKGYVSWSPKDVFERAYHMGVQKPVPIDNFYTRLEKEKDELLVKYNKLLEFLGSDKFQTLSGPDRDDLTTQAELMYGYAKVLTRRLERLS